MSVNVEQTNDDLFLDTEPNQKQEQKVAEDDVKMNDTNISMRWNNDAKVNTTDIRISLV